MTMENTLNQEVNLYQIFKAPPPVTSLLTWRICCLACILLVLIFILMTFISWGNIIYLKHKKNVLTKTLHTSESQFYAIKSKYPAIFFAHDVGGLMKNIQEHIESQQKILRTITQKKPFSSDLTLIGQLITPDVWLTDIMINDGLEFTFKGNSLSMPALRLFLDNILNNKRYAAYTLHINKIEQTPTGLNFEIMIKK